MREVTARCLRDCFCANSMAHVRYLLFAQKAKEENFPGIAHLFRALALSRYTRASEQYHLVNELIGTRAVSTDTFFIFARTMDNLERARDAEAGEANELLPAYAAVAESQGEEGAARSLKRSAVISRRRAALLDDVIRKTKHAAEEPKIDGLYVCRACCHFTDLIAQEGCPVCGSERTGFIAVT
jgi:rubrerythrin